MGNTENMNAAGQNDNEPQPEKGGAYQAAERAYFASRGESGLPAAAEGGAEGSAALPRETGAARVKTVPHAALHAEREEHKKTRAELQAMQEKARAWQRDLAAYAQTRFSAGGQGSAAGAPLPPPPDPREDFLGFARWQGEEISRLNEELKARRGREEAGAKAQQAEAALMREWDEAVSAERAERADIDEALEFLSDARLKQLSVLAAADSRFADRAFCERQIKAELRDIIIGAFQQGANPAKAVYNIAAAYGYGRDETARLGKISAAASAARSFAAGAGAPVGDPYLLETVANMPEAEFAAWYEKNKGSFRRLFGG